MIKKIARLFKSIPFAVASLALVSTLGFATIADASSTTGSTSTPTAGSGSTVSQDQVAAIIVKGDAEIARRLNTLNNLANLISDSTKLTSADKSTLTSEVNSEISGLHSDKTTLDGATTLIEAHTAAQSIFTEYRVYALVVPQIYLIRAADRQQLIESKLTSLAAAITTALGNNITAIQSNQLSMMKNAVTNATNISTSVESSVIALTPADYNSSHSLLLQYYTQLSSAKTDITEAISTAKTLISSIK